MSAREHRGPRGAISALLRAAVRRWPAHLRDEQCREWTAELDALRDEPRSGLRRLAFVVSLAFGPAPWVRPATVTVAVRLLYLLAAMQVIGLVVQLSQAGTVADVTENAYRGTGDEDGARAGMIIETTVGVILAGLFTIAYIVLAIFNSRGKDPARSTTRVIGGIGICLGAIGLIAPAATMSLSFSARIGPVVGLGPDVQWQVNDALPSWYNQIVITLGVTGLLAVFAVIILLALPPSTGFFHKSQRV